MSEETLSTGQLAQRLGIGTSAIRYYERVGVLPPPDRTVGGGLRRYGPDAIRRLEVVGIAKHAGFSLDEIRLVLQRAEAGDPAFEALRELATRKLPEIEALISRAQAMRDWLVTVTDPSCTTLDACTQLPHQAESDKGETQRPAHPA